MIKLKNITKSFDRLILNNVNLELIDGNIYVVKGISGSGKTTLFNIITFLDTNYNGDYFWNEINVKDMNEKELEEVKNSISYVFQKSYLFKKLTIKENLLFIKNDIDLINKYAKKFNIFELLEKNPEELSGGERQRVALVRALILDTKVIVLDEPTSSLDKGNALIFADYLKEVVNDNKIIIIATHKNIYDSYANAIYSLEYGNLKEIKVNINKFENKIINNTINNKSILKYDYLYVRKRKKKRIVLFFIMLIFFLLTLFSVSIYKNIKRETINKYYNIYPLQVFSLSKNDYDSIDKEIEKTYYNYKLEYNDYNAYILLDLEDSSLKDKSILKYGSFPNNNNEVLVNIEFVTNNLNCTDYKKALNARIIIENEEFTVTGIIGSGTFDPYATISFYNEIEVNDTSSIKPAIFIPYDKMKELGIKSTDNDIVITLSKSDTIKIYSNYSSNYDSDFSYHLPWSGKINNEFSEIYNIFKIGLLISIVLEIFIFIFMISKISLELYYKKKELGYLQLYRVSKDRIHIIFLLDYLIEPILSLIISVILFNVICIIIYVLYDCNFFLQPLYLVAFIFIVLIYFYALVSIPVLRYLKKDILYCINNE